MTLGHLRRWMLLPIGVASLVQALGPEPSTRDW